MKILDILNEAKNEIDPAQVTPADIAAYVRHVKAALKDKLMTKGTIAAAVREIAEDDPKFDSKPKALPALVTAVCAKLVAMPIKESMDDDSENESIPAKFSASSTRGELLKQKMYLKAQMKENSSNRMMVIKLTQALKKIDGFLSAQGTKE